MKKHLFKFSIVMLFGMTLLISACRKDSVVYTNTGIEQNLLQQVKRQFTNEMADVTNNFAKNINLVPIWEKAITDEKGNIRVPVNFGLNNKKNIGIVDDLFELYVSTKTNGLLQIKIVHFIKVGEKYHSEVLDLKGRRYVDIFIDQEKALELSLKDKLSRKVMAGGGTAPTNLAEYFSLIYNKPVVLVALQHCPDDLLFNPNSCMCDWPESAGEDATDEFFLIVFEDGDVKGVPAEGFLDTVIILPDPSSPGSSPNPSYPSEPGWPSSGGGGGGGYFPPEDGSSNTNPNTTLTYSQIAEASVVDDGKPKIQDIKKYTDCFNDSKIAHSYTMTIYVDQPVPGQNDSYKIVVPTGGISTNIYGVPTGVVFQTIGGQNFDVGHTFVTFEKNNTDGTNVRQTLGFYPSSNPISSKGAMKDNSGHNADVKYTMNVTKEQFEAALQRVESDFNNKDYNLTNIASNEYNCTSAAISWMNAAGANFSNSSSGLFKNTPGSFGQVLRGKQGAYVNPTSGINGKGPCN